MDIEIREKRGFLCKCRYMIETSGTGMDIKWAQCSLHKNAEKIYNLLVDEANKLRNEIISMQTVSVPVPLDEIAKLEKLEKLIEQTNEDNY